MDQLLQRDIQEELRRAEKERDFFRHTVLHELRSPTTNIMGFNTILKEASQKLLQIITDSGLSDAEKTVIVETISDEIVSPVEYIETGCKQISSILNGINKIHEISSDPLKPERLDMNLIMQSVMGSLEFLKQKRKAEVQIDTLPPCTGDKDKISTAFHALLENALLYLSPERPGKIRINGESSKGFSLYCIEDNGVGIPEDFREKIFGLSKRVTPRGSIKGEGLGLSIARKIFELHDGEIWLKSATGHGSLFFVSLPCEEI